MDNLQLLRETERIGDFIKSFLGPRKAVVGISGGIDSALVLAILSRSIPRDRIIALHLPEAGLAGNEDGDINSLSSATGVPVRIIPIDPMVRSFVETLNANDRMATGNMKSRIRMIALYYYANSMDGMVIGTTNRTEFVTGYYTKFGDGACDVEPIMHLLKFQVRELARYLGVPKTILEKRPSAGLWDGQSDESELGMTYEEMDRAIIELFDRKKTPETQVERKIMELYARNEHKRRLPPSLLG